MTNKRAELAERFAVPSGIDNQCGEVTVNLGYVSLDERDLIVAALRTPQAGGMPGREEIARIIDPDAKWGELLDPFGDDCQRALLALEKADAIRALAQPSQEGRTLGAQERIALISDELARFHRNACYPAAMPQEIYQAATQIDTLLTPSRPTPSEGG